ncbi:hypothetical protein [Microbacterium sp. H1-D42]|uniref:hypothetical protein n=1 Tax=Microbacterium sp. H1-D42 TaxID=2925844 RepID=UPI001F52EBCF|nr:hypothetical protein [Microbacterium sp. H1-D42]UNK70030.1 hypothetical protein MNR00_12765 [Microbacterium sp. H1-D42]
MRPSRLPLLLRGGVAAVIATFTALLSHVAAGGDLPGPLGIAVPLLLSTMISVLLAGRRLSLVRLAASVSASQVLFHTLFVLGSIAPVHSAAGHQHGAPLVLAPIAEGMVMPDAGMWLGHVFAAVATTALLHRGESVLRQLLSLARTVLGWVISVVVRRRTLPIGERSRSRLRPIDADADAPIALRVVRRMPRRGPPLLSTL